MMADLYLIIIKLLLCSVLLILVLCARTLLKWAKAQRTGAYVFGALAQSVLPDPYVEHTIKVVQERKKQSKNHQKEKEGTVI